MRILLTNDDGIRAPGIVALFDALTDADGRYGGPIGGAKTEIHTIAPLTVQSATGHGVTFHKPLMVTKVDVTPSMSGTAVDARPADCVKLAMAALWAQRYGAGSRPDLLISGMNAGANVGINVIYSGTVAAALEGAFLGVPSIAVSLHIGRGRTRFDVASQHARRVIEMLMADGLPRRHECLSINIPVTESGGPLPPLCVCPMNTHGLVDRYERRVSPEGAEYYWPAGHGLEFTTTDSGTDVEALMARRVTITPLRYDMTEHGGLERWRSRLPGTTGAREGAVSGLPSPVDQGD
jgi:5'-nucleotidase